MPGMDPFGSGPGLPGSPVPGMGPVDPAIAVGIGGPNTQLLGLGLQICLLEGL